MSDEISRNPDYEILNAIRSSLATTHGQLIVISSPYARKGALYDEFKRNFGPSGDPAILVAKAPSQTMKPSLDPKVVARAYERDPAAASAEFGAEFRSDLEGYVTREMAEACVIPNVKSVPYNPKHRYHAFCDPSGGSSDSMTLGISHREGDLVFLDHLAERRAPFMPTEVVSQFGEVLWSYDLDQVTGDRYSAEWVREAFRKHGVTYRVADKSRSEIYFELLPMLTSRQCLLLDDARMLNELCSLERRTSRMGRDSVDHPVGGHDDLINPVSGAIQLAADSIHRGGVCFG